MFLLIGKELTGLVIGQGSPEGVGKSDYVKVMLLINDLVPNCSKIDNFAWCLIGLEQGGEE